MYVLTDWFCKPLKQDSRVPHAARSDLSKRLDELRRRCNAHCHGAW